MAAFSFTAAVIGSGPMAGLIAGLLAGEHGQSVCLVADRFSPLRVDRGIDLAAGPITRPETWALLARSGSEARRLVTRIAGRAAIVRRDLLVVARTSEGAAALGHVRHMAAGFAFETAPVPNPAMPGAVSGLHLHDVAILDRSVLMPALDGWLAARSVRRLFADSVEMTLETDGSLRLRAGTADLTAGHAVLADDRAILDLVGPAGLPGMALASQTALLTEPVSTALPAPVVLDIDWGAALWRARGGGLGARIPGRPQEAASRLAGLMGGRRPVRLAGQASFPALSTDDGGPVVGRLDGEGPTILAGFDPLAAFLAPALARIIAGKPADGEAAWMEARRPVAARNNAAEYSPVLREEAA